MVKEHKMEEQSKNQPLKERIKQQPRPFLIAGSCSVEGEEQMLRLAQEMNTFQRPHLLRGGIWKPRTRPNSFEGVGAVGLPWLVRAGQSIGVPVATEVANSKHVELALQAGVDVLWVGARTTANPFSVQEIVDALKGTDISIMIKNPINPDLMLWVGAFERFLQAGLTDLTAIHRGFSVYNHPRYRNAPNWEIPIGLMTEFPGIPVICDPSHISGKRDGIFAISQKAMDLNFSGLMIETHSSPDTAMSDAQQQITPEKLQQLMSDLVLRKTEMFPKTGDDFMTSHRSKISALDDKIFDLLRNRMQIAEEIGEFKRQNGITILQTEHWKAIIEKRMSLYAEEELSGEFLQILLDAIHQESIRHQTRVMNT